MVGAGPSAVFAVSDAFFAPLAARQDLRARQAGLQAAQNDSLLAVAEAYFGVQQARGELAGAQDAVGRAEELVRLAEQLAPGLVPPVEAVRARAELARRRQAMHAARERWRTASAELVRVLRLDPFVLVEPLEPPHLQVTLVGLDQPVDDLVPVALTNRPELAAQQALVQATLERQRQERLRPLVPSVLLRGAATNPSGTLAGGLFGGGRNNTVSNFSARGDFDVQVLWELQNLGLGNRARVDERRAENRLAVLELFRTQDRVAAEVVQAYAQAQAAADRVREAETGLKHAVDSVRKNFEGLKQTRRAGDVILLVIRPQEVVAAVQALAQAYNDYYGAVADYDRAQFRLYRALGHPAQALTGDGHACPVAPGSCKPMALPSSIPPISSFGADR
jgi:outer membrane protein TolC